MKRKNTVRCPYCGAQAKLRPAATVYGKATIDENSYVYLCDRYPACDSYVNAHPQTKEPMGMLADGNLRNKRIQAHHALDALWKKGTMSKKEAYRWLGVQLGLPAQQTHIAMFGEYMCDSVIKLCNERMKTVKATI